MKQVLQSGRGPTVVRDVPAPPCPPGAVLVRNRYSVISSGTESARVELSQKSLVAKARERPDLVRQVIDRARAEGVWTTFQAVAGRLGEEAAAGYSSAGRVVEVGPAVRGISPGDAVACAGAGHANHAEIVSVPANLCAVVPPGVPLRAAAFGTIASIGLHGIRLAGVELGDRVAVVGCGLVGQIACRLLAAAGARVFAIDLDPARVRAAEAGGAEGFVVGPGTGRMVRAAAGETGVDKALVTAAASDNRPLLLAGEILRDRGTLVVVGAVRTDMPRSVLYEKEILVRVSRSYGPGRYDRDYEERGLDYPIGYVRWTEKRNLECVLDLLARGRLELEDLVEEEYEVTDAPRAYERLAGPAEERPRGAIVLSYPAEGGSPAGSPRGTAVSPTPVRAQAPSKGTVRLGLIGPGNFAQGTIVPAFAAAGVRLELVGGGTGPRAKAAVRKLGFARLAASESAVIEDRSVDAVAICTRHSSHARLAQQALEEGKHVFCEKPVALTAAELDAVLEAAARSGRVLAVGFNRRFAPLIADLRRFVDDGSARLTASYRVSAGRLAPDHWTHDLDQGGGRALGEACHFVDTIAYLTGSPIVRVDAVGHGHAQAPIQARDNLLVSLVCADGSVGNTVYVADGSSDVPKERLEVFRGSRTGVLDDFRALELHEAGSCRRKSARSRDKGHRAEVAAFVAGVRRGEAPVSLAEVDNVSRATVAIIESLRTGRPVELVPTATW